MWSSPDQTVFLMRSSVVERRHIRCARVGNGKRQGLLLMLICAFCASLSASSSAKYGMSQHWSSRYHPSSRNYSVHHLKRQGPPRVARSPGKPVRGGFHKGQPSDSFARIETNSSILPHSVADSSHRELNGINARDDHNPPDARPNGLGAGRQVAHRGPALSPGVNRRSLSRPQLVRPHSALR